MEEGILYFKKFLKLFKFLKVYYHRYIYFYFLKYIYERSAAAPVVASATVLSF